MKKRPAKQPKVVAQDKLVKVVGGIGGGTRDKNDTGSGEDIR